MAPPTRNPETETVAVWVAGFASLTDELLATADVWMASEADRVWLAALQGQSAAHLARLDAEDPVFGGPPVFTTPTPSLDATATVVDGAEALAAVSAAVTAGTPTLQSALEAADTQQQRLLVVALMTASTASLTPSLPPYEGPTAPSPFAEVAASEALAISLGHARALIRGLELGLGRLATDDALQVPGAERLGVARQLRNALLENMAGELPEVDNWTWPNAMVTAAEIQSAWAVLETNLLDALSVLTAAGDPSGAGWEAALLGQVPWVHRWGGQLPYWPGWVATAT